MPVEQPQIGAPDLVAHTGFILAEDEALKSYLSGLQVPERPGSANLVDVGVWFRFPESERQIKYPFITLDLITVEPAFDLFTSIYENDPVDLYWPSTRSDLPPLPPGRQWAIPNFLPFRLIYQVMVHCRSSLHDRYLLGLFMTDVVPPRPFWLGVDADGTWRRMERVGFNQADIPETTESGTKRIFRKVHTLSMLAEIPQSALFTKPFPPPDPPEINPGILRFQVLRSLMSVVDQEMMDQYYEAVLRDQSDPINTFTQEERELQGEYFHTWDEGRIVTPAGEPPPG